MSLKTFEVLGFRFHSILFGYLYPLPIKWNKNYTELSENLPRYKWIPYAFISSQILFFGWISFYAVLQYIFGRGHPDFKLFNAISLTMMASITFFFAILFVVTVNNRNNLLQFVNFVLSITAKISNGKNRYFCANSITFPLLITFNV